MASLKVRWAWHEYRSLASVSMVKIPWPHWRNMGLNITSWKEQVSMVKIPWPHWRNSLTEIQEITKPVSMVKIPWPHWREVLWWRWRSRWSIVSMVKIPWPHWRVALSSTTITWVWRSPWLKYHGLIEGFPCKQSLYRLIESPWLKYHGLIEGAYIWTHFSHQSCLHG